MIIGSTQESRCRCYAQTEAAPPARNRPATAPHRPAHRSTASRTGQSPFRAARPPSCLTGRGSAGARPGTGTPRPVGKRSARHSTGSRVGRPAGAGSWVGAGTSVAAVGSLVWALKAGWSAGWPPATVRRRYWSGSCRWRVRSRRSWSWCSCRRRRQGCCCRSWSWCNCRRRRQGCCCRNCTCLGGCRRSRSCSCRRRRRRNRSRHYRLHFHHHCCRYHWRIRRCRHRKSLQIKWNRHQNENL